jgi:hypothetical protein
MNFRIGLETFLGMEFKFYLEINHFCNSGMWNFAAAPRHMAGSHINFHDIKGFVKPHKDSRRGVLVVC